MKDSEIVSVTSTSARLRIEQGADRRQLVGHDQRLDDLVVEVEHEQQHQRRERYQRAERRLRVGLVDACPAGAAEAHQHGDRRRHELQRQHVKPRHQPDQRADQGFRHDQRQQHRRIARGVRRDLVPQMDEQRTGRGDRHEQPDLDRHAGAGHARHQQEAAADPAEGDERRDDDARQRGVHEIVPSTRISTPLAISTCDSTGKVGNSRSMIMRT